jgi:hypothetical protein
MKKNENDQNHKKESTPVVDNKPNGKCLFNPYRIEAGWAAVDDDAMQSIPNAKFRRPNLKWPGLRQWAAAMVAVCKDWPAARCGSGEWLESGRFILKGLNQSA